MVDHPHVYTTREEARRIVTVIYDTVFTHRSPSCSISRQELASLRNSLACDVPEVEFTPRRTGIVGFAFGGKIMVP